MLAHKAIFGMMTPYKDAILAEGVKGASAGGAKPTGDMVKATAVEYAKSLARGWLLPGLIETCEAAVKAFEAARGPRPNVDVNEPGYVAWRGDLDDYIMACLSEDVCQDIGQDFCGEYFTDTEFDNPDIRNRACQIAAGNLVEAAVRGRSNAQVLAEIGIVEADVAAVSVAAPAGAAPTVAKEAQAIDETTARVHVERLIGAWAIRTGIGGIDPAKLAETLKLCFDEDFFLSLGPIETQFGGNKDDVPYFVAYHKAAPSTCVDHTVAAAMMAAMTGTTVEPAAKPKGKGGRKPKNVAAPAAAASPPTGASPPHAQALSGDDAALIRELRDLRLVKDEDMGTLLGVSRPQVSNIANKGKPISLSAEQKATLLAKVDERIAGFQTVRAKLL